jgi:cell division protein FtsB
VEQAINPDFFFYTLITLLLGVVAYFIKQLHSDFKRVEKDVSEVKATTSILRTEFKGNVELIRQRSDFLERRISYLENHTPLKR